jgi:AcrR family transcriptional regulator
MTEPAKPRKKSDRTRDTIAEAARVLFSRHGFERTTVRDIAAAAGVDPALIIRYFGGKEQLFARVAEFDLALPDLTAVERPRIGETLAAHFLSVWEGGEGGPSGLAILLRSAASNEQAAQQVREVFGRQVIPALARITGPEAAAERAGLVASQLLGMAMCRYVLKVPPVVAMPRERLITEVGRTLQRYVTGEQAASPRTDRLSASAWPDREAGGE